MRFERINIWEENEYRYSAAFGFQPNLRTYLHEDADVKPCVLVIPGGGYRMVVPSEGEIIAKCFNDKGYQAFVGTYTTNFLGLEPLKLQPLKDISRMVRLIRARADEFHVIPDRIVICGFSAGAHLCGALCVHWQDVLDSLYPSVSNRPDGAILSYPVITSGEFAHRDSFTALLGDHPSDEELAYMSLEKQVTKDTPPMFLWQTASDETVPVENSYLMAMALKQAGVPFEHHVFPKGRHGLSLANEDWANGRFGEPYVMEQMMGIAEAAKNGEIEAPQEAMGFLNFFIHPEAVDTTSFPAGVPVKEVAVWPDLADVWMKENCFVNQ